MAWYDSNFAEALGFGLLAFGLGGGFYLCNEVEDDNRPQGCNSGEPAITQHHVLGHEQPEVYIRHDGTPYFSHIDGKSVEDFVSECYQPEQQPPEVVPVAP